MAIYNDSPPKMNSIFLHSIEIIRAGLQIRLVFDLEEFPKNAPRKWTSQGYNCVQLSVLLLNTLDLKIEGFNLDCLCSVDVYECKNTKRLVIKIHNESLNMNTTVHSIDIEKISAYLR